jgi:hypothetical protein
MPNLRSRRAIRLAYGGIVVGTVLVALVMYLFRAGEWVELHEADPMDEPADHVAQSYNGTSDGLQQTVIVPTLDTPFPEGKSAVWCLSFQLAWNAFKTDVVKGPVRLQNGGPVVDRLNAAEPSAADLDTDSYYAAAGLIQDHILETIRGQMAKKFPDVSPLALSSTDPGTVALAYAYMKAGVRYQHMFFNNPNPLVFTDSRGKQTAVASFGITDREKYKDGQNESFRGQVRILWDADKRDQFAIDLSAETAPNQIVLARVKRRESLAATLADLQQNMERAIHNRLGDEDTLLVPNMYWHIEHRFRELEGSDKRLLGPPLAGLYLGEALQIIDFKMDRKGAEVASEAKLGFLDGGPARYHFDRPFLVYLKKRTARHPFLVIWVDNAELLMSR